MTGMESRGNQIARIVLPGHADTEARVEMEAITLQRRALRTLMLAAAWGTLTTAVFFITIFDPFMTSMPALVGAASVWRGWRGRYQLRAFAARCPRCSAEIALRRNARVGHSHPLVCYSCHHEPRLVLG
jgi:hypothetical protein